MRMPSTRSCEVADAARGDHRHIDGVDHRPGQPQVEAGPGAVAIHAGQQDLARAEPHYFLRPRHRVDAGRRPAAVHVDLPGIDRVLLGVDGGDDALRAEASGRFREQFRIRHAGGVDADLVGAGVEQRADIVDGVDATADRQRNEHLRGDRLDHVVEQATVLDARADVEKGEFVGALFIVAPGDLDRVARVAQVDEVDALDHTSVGDVEAGNDALGEAHGGSGIGNRAGIGIGIVRPRVRPGRRAWDEPIRRGHCRAAGGGARPRGQAPAAALSASLKFSVPS